jgi:hypothetical protein
MQPEVVRAMQPEVVRAMQPEVVRAMQPEVVRAMQLGVNMLPVSTLLLLQTRASTIILPMTMPK